jgi:HlyD family secretion protein
MNFLSKIPAYVLLLTALLLLPACSGNNKGFDATGTFESDEVIVSAEANGKLLQFKAEEGKSFSKDEVVGLVDTVQLYLKKKQLIANIKALLSKQPEIAIQLATIQEQIESAKRDQKRIQNLVSANAASQKQLDDINSQLELLNKQYAATKSSLAITSNGLQSETLPLLAQIEQIDDQINKSIIRNPINGIVLTKYAEPMELTANGKALYKIANLDELNLKAYISGGQLPQIKIGQQVRVFVDKDANEYKEMQGEITWISSKAEFTPKTIQTKDERANLVYAIKVKVKNDGYLKIGMYGEIKLK